MLGDVLLWNNRGEVSAEGYRGRRMQAQCWVLGACRGKRSGVFGAFLLAVYNPEGEEFQTISKIGTGFSEEQLKQFSEELRLHTIPTAKPYYRCAHATHFCSPMSTSDAVSVL